MAKRKSTVEDSRVSILRTKGKDFAKNNPKVLFDNADYLSGKVLFRKWTYALLSKEEYDALARVSASKNIVTFSNLASVDVGIVTGANKFFLVPDSTVQDYGLENVSHPMFGRSEHCPGVIYDVNQHRANAEHGYPTNFLYFENEDDGRRYEDYLSTGLEQDIHTRYKCRIRKPWFKVPSVYATPVSMVKRSNGIPRLISNRMGAYTTDTAYRIIPNNTINSERLVYCFINTVTALSAELEGRFYGGGVLELVPSEIGRLLVPYIPDITINLEVLDHLIRAGDMQTVLDAQDSTLFSKCADVKMKDIRLLRNALDRLRLRRQRISE